MPSSYEEKIVYFKYACIVWKQINNSLRQVQMTHDLPKLLSIICLDRIPPLNRRLISLSLLRLLPCATSDALKTVEWKLPSSSHRVSGREGGVVRSDCGGGGDDGDGATISPSLSLSAGHNENPAPHVHAASVGN